MKNLLTIASYRQRAVAAIFVATLGLGACQVTSLEPRNAIADTDIYNSPSRIALAVTGVYNSAQSGFYDPLTGGALAVRGYPFGAAANALDDARGEDVVDMAGFFGLVYTNNITTTSPNVVNMWSNCYAVINQANVTIDGVRAAAAANVIPAATAAMYEGELRFLRALAHHELVLHFSLPYTDGNGSKMGIPYRDYAINDVESVARGRAQDRGTVAADYTAILADLTYAEANLPETRIIGGVNAVTRATKGAAIALKQRVRLHQRDWTGVVAEGTKLIAGVTAFTSPTGNYTLQASQRAAFPGPGLSTSENVFSIENRTDDNATTNGGLASVYGSLASLAIGGLNGRSLLAVSPILYNAPFFTCADQRRTVMMQLDPAGAGRYTLRKYTDAATNADYAPIIRYAEVLLNQAEALSRLGSNNVQALNLLNAVRNRSVTNAADQYAAGSLTGVALTQAILNERRIEFVGEGRRWADISRLARDTVFAPVSGGGIPSKFNGNLGAAQISTARYGCQDQTRLNSGSPRAVGAVNYPGTFFLWPIPAAEMANNPTLARQQNSGY